MAVNALIQFTQGPNTDIAGRAVIGTLTDGDVTITNGDNTDVQSWTIDLLYAPPGSSTVAATPFASGSNSSTPTALLPEPDARGCYRIRLTVYSQPNFAGTSSQDIRNFAVPEENGGINPPFQVFPPQLPYEGTGNPAEKPDEMNFGGQPYGWAGDDDPSRPMMFQNIRSVDRFKGFFETRNEDRGSALVLLGPVVEKPTRPVFDGTHLWVGQYTYDGSWSDQPNNGYVRALENDPDVPPEDYGDIFFTEGQNFDYSYSGPNWYSSMIAYDSLTDQVILVRMANNAQTSELLVATLSQDEPSIKGPDTNIMPLLPTQMNGILMAVFCTPGWLWIIRETEIIRVDTSNFTNVIRVYMDGGSYVFDGYYAYDSVDRYGDGEGRIWATHSWDGFLSIKPSTGTVDVGPITPQDVPIASNFWYNFRGIAVDEASGRIHASMEGQLDGVSSDWLVSFDILPLFDNRRAYDWAGSTNTARQKNFDDAMDVVFVPSTGYTFAMANRLADNRFQVWWLEDDGASFIERGVNSYGGSSFGGIGTSPLTVDDYPVPPRFYYIPDTGSGFSADGTVFIAQPTEDGANDRGFILAFNGSSPYNSRELFEGAEEFVRTPIAHLAGDLYPDNSSYGTSSPENPIVSGIRGYPVDLSSNDVGMPLVTIGSTSQITRWEPQPFPWGRTYNAYVTSANFQANDHHIAMTLGLRNSPGRAGVWMPRQKGLASSSFSVQRSYVSLFGDNNLGQDGGYFEMQVNPQDTVGDGLLHGIDSTQGLSTYELRNTHEAIEFGWAYDTGIDPTGRWTCTNHYRPWEHYTAVNGTTLTVWAGKAIVRADTSTGTTNINLPPRVFDNDWCIIKDVDGLASSNNVTINGNGNNIDGLSSYTLDTNRGSVVLRYSRPSGQWEVIATNGGGGGGGVAAWGFVDVTTSSATLSPGQRAIVRVKYNGFTTVTLPATPGSTDEFVIKDYRGTGFSAGNLSYAINVDSNGNSFDNDIASTHQINLDQGALHVVWDSAEDNWVRI